MIKVKVGGSRKYTKLSVFDFDGTLFKSPDKPSGYKGNWWIKKDSLGPPAVPEIPEDSFWNLDVVQSATKELSNDSTFCILLTGRIDQFFEDRIKQLISQKKLNFNFIKLNSFGQDTGEFKLREINNILNKNKSIKEIEMWEDEPEKIELYTSEFSNKYNFKINKIGEE